METLATGPARLLRAHPDLVGHITSLGERNRASMLAIPETLDRIREKARVTDPGSAAARALDAACLLGYLAAISDTLLATYFRMKEGDLPESALAVRKLEDFLNGLTRWWGGPGERPTAGGAGGGAAGGSSPHGSPADGIPPGPTRLRAL